MPTLREQAAARRRRSEADAHESFVEGLLPLLKPCTLIGFALLLTQLHGPPDSDHGSHLLHDGARGDLLDASPSHAERHRSATNRSTCTVASANRSLACRAALDETRELVAGADPDPLGHESNGSLPCPGLQAAMGARTVPPGVADRGAVHGRSWTVACGLPPVAAVQPRVYVHRFMDGAHRELLRAPAVARFFDLWHPLNAQLAEFAFHRSLAAGPFATEDADAASFYFVPFYARMALEARRDNASLHAMLLTQLRAGLLASPHFHRAQGRDHMLVVPTSRPMAAMFRGVLPLVAGSIWLTVGLGEARPPRRAAGGGGGGGGGEDESEGDGEATAEAPQPNRVAVPHFAPWLQRDDDSAAAARRRRYSVCLQAPPDSIGRAAEGGRDREARRLQAELDQSSNNQPKP